MSPIDQRGIDAGLPKHVMSSHQTLTATISDLPHHFLQPSSALHATSLSVAKEYLDPLAGFTGSLQQHTQRNIRRKRKRGAINETNDFKTLALKQLYIDGFEIDHVWEQARRILDAATLELQRSLLSTPQEKDEHCANNRAGDRHDVESRTVRFKPSDKDGPNSSDTFDVDLLKNDIQFAEDDGESGPETTEDHFSEDEAQYNDQNPESLGDEQDTLNDFDEGGLEDRSDQEEEPRGVFIPDKLGLNDGFFSIDDFNRQSEFLEQQDARGENDRDGSDEEDVDWDADPLVAGALTRSTREAEEEDPSSGDGEGPTFGNADLNAGNDSELDDDSDPGVPMDDTSNVQHTNDVKYADFFAPPPRKLNSLSRRRALPKTQPPVDASAGIKRGGEDIQRTIDSVRRDIFEDDLTGSDSGSSDLNNRRSSHQRRQAKLSEEIRKLEAAAVAKRDWTLSGEARAADRPINSLLEEDLEFERAGKPIPVITQEVSEDIEAMIKRRIIAREFDEVIRRRPGTLMNGAGKDIRRGRVELEDGKSQQSLAEMYESEHLKNIDPEGYMDKRSEALKKEHAKIEGLWKEVSSRLDALSSLHFRPKPPDASVNVITDVPTITMEDARPAGAGAVGGESMLAPQEVFKAGEARNKVAEVSTRGGQPVGREEMTREEKLRRRRRDKERIRKAGSLMEGVKVTQHDMRKPKRRVDGQREIVGDLKRGGVRVIGRKGEIKDVEGNAIRPDSLGRGAGGYKL